MRRGSAGTVAVLVGAFVLAAALGLVIALATENPFGSQDPPTTPVAARAAARPTLDTRGLAQLNEVPPVASLSDAPAAAPVRKRVVRKRARRVRRATPRAVVVAAPARPRVAPAAPAAAPRPVVVAPAPAPRPAPAPAPKPAAPAVVFDDSA